MNKLLTAEYDNLGLWYIVSFVSGIILYLTLPYEISLHQIIVLLSICLFLVVVSRVNYVSSILALLLLFFCFGIAVGKVRYINYNTKCINNIIKSKVSGRVTGISPSTRGIIICIDNCYIEALGNINSLLSVNIFVSLEKSSNVQVGDDISLRATLYPPTYKYLVHSISSDILAYFSGISAVGYASNAILILPQSDNLIGRNLLDKLANKVEHIRMNIYDRIIEQVDSFFGGFINAIILGEGHALNKTIVNAMRDAGVSHILCISGLHLSLVAAIFFNSTRFILNLSPRIAFAFNVQMMAIIISIVGSFVYLLLAGVHIAAVRAFIMTATAMIIIIIRRGVIPLRLVGLSAIIILLLNPEYILHPSFQLSFVAVISLISSYGWYNQYQQRKMSYDSSILTKAKWFIYANIYSSIVASTATMPIAIFHFYKSANYAILANLFVIPILTFWVMPLTLISIILIAVDLDGYILPLVKIGIDIMITISEKIADLPYAVTCWGKIDGVDLLIYLFGFFWIVIWQQWWRVLGTVAITTAIVRTLLAPLPDFVIDNQNMIFCTKDSDNNIKIYGGNLDNRLVDYWSSRYGQNKILFFNTIIEDTNHKIITNTGRSIALNMVNQGTEDADLIISALTEDSSSMQSTIKLNDNIYWIEVFCNYQSCNYKAKTKSRFCPTYITAQAINNTLSN